MTALSLLISYQILLADNSLYFGTSSIKFTSEVAKTYFLPVMILFPKADVKSLLLGKYFLPLLTSKSLNTLIFGICSKIRLVREMEFT